MRNREIIETLLTRYLIYKLRNPPSAGILLAKRQYLICHELLVGFKIKKITSMSTRKPIIIRIDVKYTLNN